MKDLPTEEYVIEDDEEQAPTAMELALREALEKEGVDLPPEESQKRRRKKSKRRRDVQDEIIARTLDSRQD
jgi:hypothetical protein